MNTNPALQPPVPVNAPGAAPAAPAPKVAPTAPAKAPVPQAPRKPQATVAPVRQPAAPVVPVVPAVPAAPAVPVTPTPAAAVPVPQPQAAAVPAPTATTPPPPPAQPRTFWQRVGCAAKDAPVTVAKIAAVMILGIIFLIMATAMLTEKGDNAIATGQTKAAREQAAELATKVANIEQQFAATKASEEELKRQVAARDETIKQVNQQLAAKPAAPVDPSVEKLKAELAEIKKAELVRGTQPPPPRAEAVTTSTRTEETFKSTSSGQQGGRGLEKALIEGLKNRTARVDLGTGRVIFKGDEDKVGAGLPFVQIYRWAQANGYRNFRLNDPRIQEDLLSRYDK